ncbi:MAG: hypothetical protein K2M84_02185 [Anaeroplasmataceae bacterium]|nr:hypothetical protein [Anaeroplasmataceae bacterium]
MKKIGFLFIALLAIFMCSCTDSPEMLYEEACNRWEEFLAADQLSLVTKMEVSAKRKDEDYFLVNETASAEAKICKAPFYMEAQQNGELMIIQEEQGKLYSYVPSALGSKYLERSYFGDMNSLDDATNSYYDEEPLLGLKVQDMRITYEEDTYIFKINMYKFLQNYKDSEEIKDIISSLGGDAKLFKNFWVTLSMSFSETIADLKIEMEYEYDGICLNIIMDTKFDNQKFEKRDIFNDSSYTVLHPDTISSVYRFSSVGKVIRIPSYSANYFKFNFEKGQYGFYATDELGTGTGNWIDDWAISTVKIKLYNEKYEEIPVGMGINSYETFSQRTFYISEPGTYYLYAQSDISADMDICINKLNYDTIGFENTQEMPTSYKGKIEGEYDFDFFTIDGKEGEILVFKNTGQTPIPLIFCDYIGNNLPSIGLNVINDDRMIKLNEGENKFVICSNFRSYQEPFEYEFTTQKYFLENGYEENYEDLKKVTTDLSDLTYIAGHSLPNPRLTFEVETKSIIDFEFEKDGISQSDVYAIVKDLEENRYFSINGNIFELEPGSYILEISSNSDFDECRVKYTATEIEDKEINVTLEESSLSELLSDDFPTVKAQNVGRTQKVKCNFTINEDTLIVFEPSVKVYQHDGTPVFYFGNTYYTTVYLTQGEYYYLIEGSGSYYYDWSNPYTLGIVNDTLETTSNPNQMKEIQIGQELMLKKDWSRDEDFLILHIQEDGFYNFNHMVEVYDEDFRYMTFAYGSTRLMAGKYYLIYPHDPSTEINQEVPILIIKK